jgi:DNA-directed RNA polymerase subunit K/omega
MEGLPEGIDSKFRYVLLVSKRAEQLIQGAQARTRSKQFVKPTRVAMEEVANNQVKWQMTAPVEETTSLESDE